MLPQNWKVIYTFVDNCAGNGGHSIFATTLASCVWFNNQDNDLESELNITQLLQEVFMWSDVFNYDGNCNCTCQVKECHQIATKASQFDTNRNTLKPLKLYPGKSNRVELKIKDDRGQPTYAVFVAQIYNNNKTAIDSRALYCVLD